MVEIRQRILLWEGAKPKLRRHVRLHYDPVRSAWALLSPERVFWPNEVGLDILRLCDGEHSFAAITTSLAEQYEAPQDAIAPDVGAFLQEWSDRFLVTL